MHTHFDDPPSTCGVVCADLRVRGMGYELRGRFDHEDHALAGGINQLAQVCPPSYAPGGGLVPEIIKGIPRVIPLELGGQWLGR